MKTLGVPSSERTKQVEARPTAPGPPEPKTSKSSGAVGGAAKDVADAAACGGTYAGTHPVPITRQTIASILQIRGTDIDFLFPACLQTSKYSSWVVFFQEALIV